MKSAYGLLLACVASALSIAPASADAIVGGNPADVLNLAKGYGSASMDGTSSDGKPLITGRMDGQSYIILFGGCDGSGLNCTQMQFGTAWAIPVTLEQINAWNRGKVFGSAYRDGDGDLAMQYSVNLRHGVTRRNLDDTVDWWRVIMKQAAEEF